MNEGYFLFLDNFCSFFLYRESKNILFYCIIFKIIRRKLFNFKKYESIKYLIEEIRKNVMEMVNLFKFILKS